MSAPPKIRRHARNGPLHVVCPKCFELFAVAGNAIRAKPAQRSLRFVSEYTVRDDPRQIDLFPPREAHDDPFKMLDGNDQRKEVP